MPVSSSIRRLLGDRTAIPALVACLAMLFLLVAASVGALGTPMPSAAQADPPSASPVTSASGGSMRPTTSTSAEAQSPSSPYPQVTADATAKECAREGSGPWAAVAVWGTTSCPFAIRVRTAYLASGLDGQAGLLRAYSPTTKQWYDMSCSVPAPAVLCQGGRSARVLIYGGTLVPGPR